MVTRLLSIGHGGWLPPLLQSPVSYVLVQLAGRFGSAANTPAPQLPRNRNARPWQPRRESAVNRFRAMDSLHYLLVSARGIGPARRPPPLELSSSLRLTPPQEQQWWDAATRRTYGRSAPLLCCVVSLDAGSSDCIASSRRERIGRVF